MRFRAHAAPAARGFSLVELLVTILLAGIFFAAVTPVFVSALKKSAADDARVTATNIAQERIEKARLLDYADVTITNLNSTTIGPNWFGPVEQRDERSYSVSSIVDPADDAYAAYKAVTVDVSWSETTSGGVTTPRRTTVRTVVKNPAVSTETTQTGSGGAAGGPGPWDVTVSFKDWRHVTGSTSYGVSIVRRLPTPVATLTPSRLRPDATHQTVSWADVPGGRDITYVVECRGAHGTFTTPPFHLLSDAPIHFDTWPGH